MGTSVGEFTIINGDTYTCVKIEGNTAFLKKTTEVKGRFLEMEVNMVPYFENGELITPEKEKIPYKETINKTLNIPKIIREHTGMTVSRDLALFASEWVETLVLQLADVAYENAKAKGHKRLKPAHWYILQLGPETGRGYWPSNDEVAESDYNE